MFLPFLPSCPLLSNVPFSGALTVLFFSALLCVLCASAVIFSFSWFRSYFIESGSAPSSRNIGCGSGRSPRCPITEGNSVNP